MATKDEMRALRIAAYNIISENPCTLFPEFMFARNGKGWYSTNTRKIDGTDGTSKSCVWIYDNKPGHLWDYRAGQSITFWDYLEQIRGVPSPFKELMEYAGLTIPVDKQLANSKVELVAKTHPYILNKCLSIFAEELGVTDIGCEVRAYLAQRGYTDTQIARMRLGALPELDQLKSRLENELSIEQKYINFFIKSLHNEYNGQTYSYMNHRLTIPCYGKYGALEGFIFRTIDPSSLSDNDAKYKNMADMNRNDGVLNFPRGCKEIIIVEGVLDALLAKSEGIRNVVSLNGSGLNNDQITALADAGIERIVLCLDNDTTGQENTYRITKRIVEHDVQMMVYITQLPDGCKDVDELITAQDRDAFYDEIHYSIGMGEYLAGELIKQFPKRDVSRPLPSMQRDRLLRSANIIRESMKPYPFELETFNSAISRYSK